MENFGNSNFDQLAIQLLEILGNKKPTKKQIKLARALLIKKNLTHEIFFHKKLSNREASCLFLAANGITIEESAEVLGVKPSTIKTWRTNLIRKLDCTSIAQAVFKGIGYGYIPINIIPCVSATSTFVGKNN